MEFKSMQTNAVYQFTSEQILQTDIETAWDFISNPCNLTKITPKEMNFNILSDIPQKIYPGLIIIYKVNPIFNIPITWVTEISVVVEKQFFVDIQKIGPYKFWHHQHHLIQTNNGVLMKDIINYKLPIKLLSSIMNKIFIKKQLIKIFNYRKTVLDEIFNK